MIKVMLLFFLIFAVTGIFMEAKAQDVDTVKVKTVKHVDLEKYAGLWYEIARIPNKFQKDCKSNTTATYTLRSDGNIDVLNRCIEDDGSVNTAEGLAKIVDDKTNAKLEVSFFSILGIHFFWGDYWIIGLDKDYDFAVVGHPDRKYGWILSRTPKLPAVKLQEAFKILEDNGYKKKDFVMTAQ